MAEFTFSGIKLTSEGQKYMAEINKLVKQEVHVGFQEGAESYDDGTDLLAVVAYNEFGTSDIPARPFIRQSFENHEPELHQICQSAMKDIYGGGTAEAALKKLGVFTKGLMQDEVVSGGFAANAPSTIKKKGSSTPLVDTGHMRQSINYEIKPR